MGQLAPRHAQILALAAQGNDRREIANLLFLSPWTVDNVFKAAREVLGAKNNEQAIVKAIATEQLILDHEGHVTAPTHIRRLIQEAA